MTHQLVTKIVAGLLIPCLTLSAISCYSYQTVELEEAAGDEDLIVGTKDRQYYRLRFWTADSLGNINGRGGESSTLEGAKDQHNLKPFNGTIPVDNIAAFRTEQPNTLGTVILVLGLAAIVGGVAALIMADQHVGRLTGD